MIKKLTILLTGLVLSLQAAAMTVEEKQRFLYYFYAAEQLWEDEQYFDAFEVFNLCHVLNPKDAITNRYIGHIYNGCQYTDLALVYFKMAWEQSPKDCWREYAVTLYNTGHPSHQEKAIEVLEQTSRIIPDESDLWDKLREAYLGMNLYKKALKAQKEVDRIDGYGPWSAMQQYKIYVMMRKPQKAVEAIEEYLKTDPSNLQMRIYQIQLYEAMHKPAKVLIPVYKEILKLDPFNAMALNNYAYALATSRGGDLALAERMSVKAIQAEPANPTYLDTYAWILYLTGQKELARIYIHQAVNQYGEEPVPEEIQQHYLIITKE